MSSGSTNGRSSSTGDASSRAVARSSSVDDLDAVVWLEATHDVGAGHDDAQREASDDAVQLVVGQAVVDRRERQPGE